MLSKVIIERLKKLKNNIRMRLQNLPSLSGNLIRIGFKFWMTSGVIFASVVDLGCFGILLK